MSAPDLTEARWRKSSRSSGNGGACVEVGIAPSAAGVRDTKLGDNSPTLAFTRSQWNTFLDTLREGSLD
ncbi:MULTISPECIES: DUF397 domain-containing protein [unclassified Actinopolyspora]|uniref:DUF397 domain-containing protein n=1 Tax=unclassified Actinopolyspora TaxID=2639451 RepID=UPI0013F66F03|nr:MULTISPECIES: DUF397 domain-containing protein [unclassified Actinopolyspora]NHD16295.1 DUF397 domain-containing protein [Actinopolyspora sp. BKK2]NHE75842.1 DUF397 domain-containing protein [Actinopolyspora sp. BKK1]